MTRGRSLLARTGLAAAVLVTLIATAGLVAPADGDGAAVSIEHDATVAADGELTVVVEANASAGTVVEVDAPAAQVDTDDEDAVRVEDGRVEFLDPNASDSTYELTVDLRGATPGTEAEVAAWVNAEERSQASYRATSTFQVAAGSGGEVTAIDHPDSASPGGSIPVTVETDASAGTVVELAGDGVELAPASDDAVRVDGNRLEFVDANASASTHKFDVNVTGGSDGATGEIAAWVNAAERSDADDHAASAFEVVSPATTGEVVSLQHPSSVDADGEFQVVVETNASAGTVVEVAGDGADVTLSSADAVDVEDDRVEFLDASQSDSERTVDVNVTGSGDGATLEVLALVNGGTRDDAEDVATGTVTVESEQAPADHDVAIARVDAGAVEEPVNVTATVTNRGDANDTADVELLVGDHGAVDEASASPAGGEATNVTLSWTPGAADDGDHELTVATSDAEASQNVTVEPDDGGGDGGPGIGLPGGGDDGSDDGGDDDSDDGSDDGGDSDDGSDDGSQDGDSDDSSDDQSGGTDGDDGAPSPDADDGDDGDDGTPGFGVVATVVALSAALLAYRRVVVDD